MSARRFFAPEVIQTSAMDCGPAALKCLLGGFGIELSYGRLREACQTAVDGTSIDTLEELARTLGLDAEQVMMPADHLLLPEAEALPAIVVVRLPSGLTHFVVVWRRHGGWVQVMDPARGRRWVRGEAFQRDVYQHTMPVPAAAFRDWAESDAFRGALRRRLAALGIAWGDRLVDAALAEPGWRKIAGLDRAVRTVAALIEAGAVRPGGEAAGLVQSLAAEAGAGGDRAGGLPPYASAGEAPAAADGEEQVSIRGAILVRVAAASRLDGSRRAALPLELRAAVEEPRTSVLATLRQLLRADGLFRWGALAAGVALAAVGTIGEALLFRALLGEGGRPGRLLAATAGLLAALFALELPLARGLRRGGGRLEETLRRLFLRKIPRLGDRYFQSRPVSDMAERAHLLHRVRLLPGLAADVLRTGLQMTAVAAALVWIHPAGAPLALGLLGAMLAIPFAIQPVLAERDLRMRNHAGALGRFYLDGLLGLVAVRTHAAEPALAREHGDRLREWARAARGAFRAALAGETIQACVGFGLAAWLCASFFAAAGATASGGEAATALLVVYWALLLPALGYELALAVQQIPAQRNLTLRLLEPIGAPEEDPGERGAGRPAAGAPPSAAVAIALESLEVVAAGHRILEVGSLRIAAGEEVAIVGPSGAGKSSLVGLLLGWHRPVTGVVRVDGRPLDAAGLEALRRRTAWVDPSVYLWNRSLEANLAFGLPVPPAGGEARAAIGEADLEEVVRRLPDGAHTALGEGGALVSGGEGQRVRFGRAILRHAPALVILDEPFRGLSREQRGELLGRARRRWAGATLLCVTHDIAETARFPRVLVVEGGRIVEDGEPAALRARSGSRYGALFEAEARVRAAAWSSAAWRRVRIEAGRIIEEPPA